MYHVRKAVGKAWHALLAVQADLLPDLLRWLGRHAMQWRSTQMGRLELQTSMETSSGRVVRLTAIATPVARLEDLHETQVQ